MATLKPSPSVPSSASAGTAQSVRNICAEGAPRMPSLSSGGPKLSPGVLVSSRKAEMPLWPWPRAGSWSTAMTTSATGPLVMKFLVPLRT